MTSNKFDTLCTFYALQVCFEGNFIPPNKVLSHNLSPYTTGAIKM